MRNVITKSKTNGYFITAYWGARPETPEQLAERFFRMIDAFKQIDPIFGKWSSEKKDLKKLRENFPSLIKRSIERDDFGEIIREAGYWFDDMTEGQSRDRNFAVQCHVGSSIRTPHENKVCLWESTMVQPDPTNHRHQVFHPALLAIVDAWNPNTVEANCHWLVERDDKDYSFRPAWMRYLSPALAQEAKAPTCAIVEHLPNGGVLLSATEQTFDVDNPNHVAAAENIAAALAGLNRDSVG